MEISGNVFPLFRTLDFRRTDELIGLEFNQIFLSLELTIHRKSELSFSTFKRIIYYQSISLLHKRIYLFFHLFSSGISIPIDSTSLCVTGESVNILTEHCWHVLACIFPGLSALLLAFTLVFQSESPRGRPFLSVQPFQRSS